MEKYLFIKATLEAFAKEDFFKKITALVIRILCGIVVIFSLVSWIKLWKVVFDMKGSDVIGGIFFQLLFIVGVYMIVHILLIRAKDISGMKKEEFYVLPIISTVLKMLGEVHAALFVFTGWAGGIFIWISGQEAKSVINTLPLIKSAGRVTPDFMGGLTFIVKLTLMGFLAIVLMYAAAEVVKIFHRVEKNTKK
ncbi:hypothetical protein KAU32_05085 [bacterium]|nr:hypothetical protein [bacterium]